MTTYNAIVTREGDVWLADVPSVSGAHTYAHTLTDLAIAVREVIMLMAGLPGNADPDVVFTFSPRPQTADLIEVTVHGPPQAMPSIVEHIVGSRLAAAGHLACIESTYWWNDRLEHRPEIRATFHTTSAMFDAVKAAVAQIHPYEVPSIVAAPLLGASAPYAQWLNHQIYPELGDIDGS